MKREKSGLVQLPVFCLTEVTIITSYQFCRTLNTAVLSRCPPMSFKESAEI